MVIIARLVVWAVGEWKPGQQLWFVVSTRGSPKI